MSVALQAQLQQWADRVDALELRERILLLAASIVVLFLVVDSLFLQPTLKAQQVAEESISTLEMRLGALNQQASLLSYQSGHDPLASRYATRDALVLELSELDSRILGQLGALVEPAQAARVLEQVLTDHRGLKLKYLQANTQILGGPDTGEQETENGMLGRYQLDMVVEGGYLDILRYLKELEAMPWKFFWQKVDFQTAEYPRAETRLQLYTLGAQDG